MDNEKEYQQHREYLLSLVNAINNEISLTEPNQVLIVYKLDTIEKIRRFFKWIGDNLEDGELKATEAEIVRAAVTISREVDNEYR